MENHTSEWSAEKSAALYQIHRWGEGYFCVNDAGDLCVLPSKNPNDSKISIPKVIEEMRNENVLFPTVIRFHDILHSQIKNLNETFRTTIKEAQFNGKYYGVFPIKVNQMREVIEEIVEAGQEYNHGLEAGSKAELICALAMNSNPDALTILNGYKDEEYMKLALLGTQMGKNIIVVIEKFSEIEMLVKLSDEIGVMPMVGVRAKLATRGSGKWAESGGESAKFGLSIAEIIKTLEYLRQNNKLDALKLFHFHIGSQITDIRTIKDAITEGARIYSKLIYAGANIEYFDVGGGVGVDYDGSRTNSPSSINYDLKDYVGDVVYILKNICDQEKVHHPHIVSESGRIITAHHSCVVFNIFGSVDVANTNYPTHKTGDEHNLVTSMRDLTEELSEKNIQEVYNDAVSIKSDAIAAFKLGLFSLDERAKLETIFWNICQKINDLIPLADYVPTDIGQLTSSLTKQYLSNFSVFQSAADAWAIGQILPVVPIHRLNEEPKFDCTLADITCDSDGKIDKFIGPDANQRSLKLHQLINKEDYIIGLFLTGAYQDIMGDMHNLFGRLNEVHVFADSEDPNGFYIEEIIRGHKKAHVLNFMQYSPESLAQTVKSVINKRIKQGKIKPRQGIKLVDFYEDSIYGYTYLNN